MMTKIVIIWVISIVWSGHCTPKRSREDDKQDQCLDTGKLYIPIPYNNPFKNVSPKLIEEYERNHFEMTQTTNDYTKWTYLEKKDLHEYCSKYFDTIHPERKPPKVITGTMFPELKNLIYITPGLGTRQIVVLLCYFNYPVSYKRRKKFYITRSTDPKFVYALDKIIKSNTMEFRIISGAFVITEDRKTRIYEPRQKINPFKDVPKEYLKQYEINHINMEKTIANDCTKWGEPKSYCQKYFQHIYPNRKLPHQIVGTIFPQLKTLIYVATKLGSSAIPVLKCHFVKNSRSNNWTWHVTISPKPSHVYALFPTDKWGTETFYIAGEVDMIDGFKMSKQISVTNVVLNQQLGH